MPVQRPPGRILVVVTRRIGDVLLTVPLVRSLKSAWSFGANRQRSQGHEACGRNRIREIVAGPRHRGASLGPAAMAALDLHSPSPAIDHTLSLACREEPIGVSLGATHAGKRLAARAVLRRRYAIQ